MATSLIATFDCALSDAHTDEDLVALADYVLAQVNPNVRVNYIMDHISSDDAADVAFADELVCQDYFDTNPLSPELVLRNLPIKELAYHLTFTEPDKATQLLNELLYYRTNTQRI